VTIVVAGCGERLGRVNAVLAAHGCRLVVGDDGGAGDDLAGGVVVVLACLCVCRCGRRPARDRAEKALEAAG
jgi:predicted site-specific integrase-resolvase